MHRDRIELQIRAITVMYRMERRRLDGAQLERFRNEARQLLANLDGEVSRHPDLQPLVADLLADLDRDDDPPMP